MGTISGKFSKKSVIFYILTNAEREFTLTLNCCYVCCAFTSLYTIVYILNIGSGFVTCSSKENHDSDADLDVDGDDTLEYGKPQHPFC